VAGVELASPWTVLGAILAIGFAVVPLVGNSYHLQIAFLMLMWGGLALSWNILGGFTGYVSFGHGAFFALGTFTIGLGQQYFDVAGSVGPELIGMLVLAGVVPLVVAGIIAYPLLRLSGGYFAIAMLGFQLALGEAFTALGFLGGGTGMPVSIRDPAFMSADHALYYLLAIVVLIALLVANQIRRSEFGYGLLAIRENADAAESVAVPTTRYKIQAFMISAFFPGVLGAFYAFHLTYFTAGSTFDVLLTLNMIVYAVVGGLGTIAGPILGASLLVFVKNVVLIGASEAHVFFTGLFIVVVMLFFPGGIVGTINDIREGEFSIESSLQSRR
jgi:branched-chain amino acid transport system permease protein